MQPSLGSCFDFCFGSWGVGELTLQAGCPLIVMQFGDFFPASAGLENTIGAANVDAITSVFAALVNDFNII